MSSPPRSPPRRSPGSPGSPLGSPLPQTFDLSALLLTPLPTVAQLPAISNAPVTALPAGVFNLPVAQPTVRPVTPQQIAQLAALPPVAGIPTIPTTNVHLYSPTLPPAVANTPALPTTNVQFYSPVLLTAVDNTQSPIDSYPSRPDKKLNENQQALVDLMETTYADRTVLRDVVLKYKNDFDKLIELAREKLHFVPINFAKVFGEPYLLDSPEKMTPDYVKALLGILGLIITLENPNEKIYNLFQTYVGAGDIPIDNPYEYLVPTKAPRTIPLNVTPFTDILAGEREYTTSRDAPSYKLSVEIVNNIWNGIVHDMSELGYDFHYFEFFTRNNPRVKTFWDNVQVTPQNFEAATMLVTPGIYNEIIHNIENVSNISNSNIVICDRNICGGRYIARLDSFGTQVVGWKKSDLRDAIKATGLNNPVTVPDPLTETYNNLIAQSKAANAAEDYDTVNNIAFELNKLPRNIDNRGRRFSQLSEMFGRSKFSKSGVMPGINGENEYMTKSYYETVYRKLFNTMINVDWAQVCQQNLIEYPKLKEIAVSEFYFKKDDIEQLGYGQICQLLVGESERRRAIQEELQIGVPEAQEAVIYQPGGKMMKQVQAEAAELRPGTFALATKTGEVISPQLQKLIDVCADPNVTREQIFSLAQEMDLEILFARLPQADPTKEDYCRVLQNYIRQVQQ